MSSKSSRALLRVFLVVRRNIIIWKHKTIHRTISFSAKLFKFRPAGQEEKMPLCTVVHRISFVSPIMSTVWPFKGPRVRRTLSRSPTRTGDRWSHRREQDATTILQIPWKCNHLITTLGERLSLNSRESCQEESSFARFMSAAILERSYEYQWTNDKVYERKLGWMRYLIFMYFYTFLSLNFDPLNSRFDFHSKKKQM